MGRSSNVSVPCVSSPYNRVGRPVNWNFATSKPSKLTFVSSTQLSYQFNDGNYPGNWSVTVINPGSRAIRSFSSSHVKS